MELPASGVAALKRLQAQQQPKLCRDCQWCAEPGPFAQCHAPANTIGAPANYTGFPEHPTYRWQYCSTQRLNGWFHSRTLQQCGREGRWFQPRSKLEQPCVDLSKPLPLQREAVEKPVHGDSNGL